METIINIVEENNQLKIEDEYESIVCGNSNYLINFIFSEKWNACKTKTAVFILDGKYILVSFEGNSVNIPTLPNGNFLSVSLISGNGNNQFATTAVRLNLKTTPAITSCVNVDLFENYVQQLHSAINKIENGNIDVKEAERAKNVLNPNLLINGNFIVNQRNLSRYDKPQQYTVDRWIKGGNSTVDVVAKGVKITATGEGEFSQYLDQFIYDSNLTLSAKINGEIFYGTCRMPSTLPNVNNKLISKNVQDCAELKLEYVKAKNKLKVSIVYSADCVLDVEHIKLEIGSFPTEFCSKLYGEEIEMCQRYYQTIKGFKRAISPYSFYDGFNAVRSPMRTTPTIKVYAVNHQQGISANENTMFDVNTSEEISVTVPVGYQSPLGFKTQCGNGAFVQNNEYQYLLVCDAEIY